MKKKRKRSTSSLSSSSASSRSSASSSSSSSRRRSKKKKKKHRRSERGSKRRRRISSRESRRSEEGKNEKDGRREKEVEEVDWYPAPPNTSATFLNQKGGPGFRVDEDGLEEKEADERRICQLYSLSAASDNEDSDSSRRERKRRESGVKGRKSSQSRSPDRTLRRSRSKERRDKNGDRGKEDGRRNSDSKRRSSLDENRKRNISCSSADSELSRKAGFQSEYSANYSSASKQLEKREKHEPSKRNSFDGGRYENRKWEDICKAGDSNREKESNKGRVEEESSRSAGRVGKTSESAGNGNVPGERPKKDLPPNLLNIFNQIAQFEKEKGVGPKK